MTTQEAIKQLQTEHDLIAGERDLDGSQFAPALLEALAMAIEVLRCSKIPNCSEPKCADGCIYGWGSSECGHCDYRSEESKTGDTISRQAAIDALLEEVRLIDGYYVENDEVIDKDDAIEAIRLLPPAQPEIIRCTECKHYREYDSKYVENAVVVQCMADRYPISETIPDGWFCAGAERRTDG